MKKQLSIIASALVLTSSAVYADSKNIDEAFKNGKVSGDISVHTQSTDTDNAADAGFTAGTIGVNYSTDSVNGFTANAGFRAGHKFGEKENDDYKGDFKQNSVMNIANISYSNDLVSVTAGRQEIDLEWLGDFNEAIVVATTAIPSTTLVAGYTNRIAAVGNDEIAKFEDISTDGAYVVDAKFEGVENTVLNPYFYSNKDLADFYGIKADFDTDVFGVTAHYAASNEKVANAKDGSIMHFEARAAVAGFAFAAGYIDTDKDAGIASLATLGDNIDPTEELGDYVYAANTSTIYASAAYTIADVELSALYAQADNDAKNEEDKEITVGAAYGITDSLSADVMYTDLSLESDNDYSKLVANLTFEF